MTTHTHDPTDPEQVERKRRVTFAKLQYGAWLVAVGFVLVSLCLPLTAEAIRSVVPTFATKLSKTPLLGMLFSGPSMAKLDGAYVAACAIYFVVLYLWRELLALWLDPEASTEFEEGPYRLLISVSGVAMLVVDGVLMYLGIASSNWGQASFSFVALLFTITYVIALVFASLVSMRLHKKIQKREEEL